MKKYQKEIIKLTAKEVLLSVFDLSAPLFMAEPGYKIKTSEFVEQRHYDHSAFLEKVRYLKKHGLVESFVEGKEKFIEITPKGLVRLKKLANSQIEIIRPKKWDGKWRLVIYDVPKSHDNERNYFRSDLIENGFQKIQESVYVHPFECTDTVNELASRLNISQYVLITISEIIQGEENLIENFLKDNILTTQDIKKIK